MLNISFAQNNSVYLQQSYSNQSFYHLVNGETANVDNNSWDLAFSTGTFNSSIRTNDGKEWNFTLILQLIQVVGLQLTIYQLIHYQVLNLIAIQGWSVGSFDVYSSAFLTTDGVFIICLLTMLLEIHYT